MKRISFYHIALMLLIGSFATSYQEASAQKRQKGIIYETVEQMPSFPGGEASLQAYLSNNIEYPDIALKNNIQGRVEVLFVVEKNGSVRDVHVDRPVDPLLEEEAIRVVKSMRKWIPGRLNGEPVRVRYMLPITFKLQ